MWLIFLLKCIMTPDLGIYKVAKHERFPYCTKILMYQYGYSMFYKQHAQTKSLFKLKSTLQKCGFASIYGYFSLSGEMPFHTHRSFRAYYLHDPISDERSVSKFADKIRYSVKDAATRSPARQGWALFDAAAHLSRRRVRHGQTSPPASCRRRCRPILAFILRSVF